VKLQVRHRTAYHYSEPVTLGHTEARLTPPTTGRQVCLRSTLHLDPEPRVLHRREDVFGNEVTQFSVETAHSVLVVEARSTLEIRREAEALPFAQALSVAELQAAFQAPEAEEARLNQLFCLPSLYVPQLEVLRGYGAQSFHPARSVVEATEELMHRIFHDFAYDPTATEVSTPLEAVFEGRRGVCQDFAHCAIGVLRAFGLPAAYCSGYLETEAPPGQEKLVGADASHAWFALYLPGQGWLEFDPTNRQRPTDRYVFLGRGRDYGDAAPLRGVVQGGGHHEVQVSVDVRSVDETQEEGEGVYEY